VDFATGGSVKWLCGGPGAGYLYVRPDLQAKFLPLVTGWAAHAAPFEFRLGAQDYAQGPMRLLNGSPAVPSLLAATAGYEVLLEAGPESVRRHSIRLTEALRADLLERGFAVPSPADPARRGGTLTVGLREQEHGPAFVAALAARDILVDHRPDSGIRVSPHFYTELDDLRAFAAAMSELRDGGGWRDFRERAGTY